MGGVLELHLDGVHVHCLADLALQPQHNLLGGLGLLVEHRLCLTSISRLLAIVPALSCIPALLSQKQAIKSPLGKLDTIE